MSKSEISGDPDAETLYVPPHWHDTHDEILRVVKGKLEITLGSVARVYTPEDGEVLIRKGVVHSLRSLKGVACTFYERTDPMVGASYSVLRQPKDDEKEIFFRNMFGNGKLATNLFAIALIAYQGDTIPALPGHFIWLEKFVSGY
ncbi:hypothetical protein H0H81_000043 [Sphagnurus paluster]|uniref:Uncharacterized protein n=1 Tax=Sphagnurus paluster TaxID=117069 RepID=A0A9P7K796_9AGAR|nr:hypothetical protein H0H81_000043 [Sphagnurus paluster]